MTNLDPFHVSSEEECRDVLETVGLWELVEKRGGLMEGLSGEMLSQGQKQLFSLARAVLRRRIRARERENDFGAAVAAREKGRGDGGILLLDEVSSNVDQVTDRVMQEIIMHEFKGYTIVMVSHRLEMVIDFDRVVVMERGCVVEEGEPRELVGMEGGKFKELWEVGHKS